MKVLLFLFDRLKAPGVEGQLWKFDCRHFLVVSLTGSPGLLGVFYFSSPEHSFNQKGKKSKPSSEAEVSAIKSENIFLKKLNYRRVMRRC